MGNERKTVSVSGALLFDVCIAILNVRTAGSIDLNPFQSLGDKNILIGEGDRRNTALINGEDLLGCSEIVTADLLILLCLAGVDEFIILRIREECRVVAITCGVALHECHRIIVVSAPAGLAYLILSLGYLVVECGVVRSCINIDGYTKLCLPLVLIVFGSDLGLIVGVSLKEGDSECLTLSADFLEHRAPFRKGFHRKPLCPS